MVSELSYGAIVGSNPIVLLPLIATLIPLAAALVVARKNKVKKMINRKKNTMTTKFADYGYALTKEVLIDVVATKCADWVVGHTPLQLSKVA